MSFLPPNTEIPKGVSNYMKFSEPENRFRVLDSAIIGWELWVEGKPLRKKENQWTADQFAGADINKFTGNKKTPQYFWAFPVYNYQTEKVEVLEITQVTVMRGMEDYLNDPDYGSDPKGYDFVVIKDEGDKVEYRVKVKPPKEIDEGITQLYKDMDINLDALYEGKNPFEKDEADKIADEVDEGLPAGDDLH